MSTIALRAPPPAAHRTDLAQMSRPAWTTAGARPCEAASAPAGGLTARGALGRALDFTGQERG